MAHLAHSSIDNILIIEYLMWEYYIKSNGLLYRVNTEHDQVEVMQQGDWLESSFSRTTVISQPSFRPITEEEADTVES